jgi:hypothetical protein
MPLPYPGLRSPSTFFAEPSQCYFCTAERSFHPTPLPPAPAITERHPNLVAPLVTGLTVAPAIDERKVSPFEQRKKVWCAVHGRCDFRTLGSGRRQPCVLCASPSPFLHREELLLPHAPPATCSRCWAPRPFPRVGRPHRPPWPSMELYRLPCPRPRMLAVTRLATRSSASRAASHMPVCSQVSLLCGVLHRHQEEEHPSVWGVVCVIEIKMERKGIGWREGGVRKRLWDSKVFWSKERILYN